MNRLLVLSILGTSLSVSNNITTIISIIQKAKSKQLDQVPKKYILINHFCQLFWISYSLRVRRLGLIMVNTMTCILSLSSNLILNYHLNNLSVFIFRYCICAFLAVYICFNSLNIGTNGLICVILGVSSTAAMYESIYKVLSTNNYRFIDLRLAISLFITGSVWFTYSVLSKEPNVIYTSGFTTMTGIFLTITYLTYRLYSEWLFHGVSSKKDSNDMLDHN